MADVPAGVWRTGHKASDAHGEDRRTAAGAKIIGRANASQTYYSVPCVVHAGEFTATIPAGQFAKVWQGTVDGTVLAAITTFDLTATRWVSFTLEQTSDFYVCKQEEFPSIVLGMDGIRLELITRTRSRWPQVQTTHVSAPVDLTLLAGDYVHLFGDSQDDYYGTASDSTSDIPMTYPDPNSHPLEQLADYQMVSRQRIAVNSVGKILAVAPDGTLWSGDNTVDATGTQVTLPDFIGSLNSGFSETLPSTGDTWTIANQTFVLGVAGDGDKWWILVDQEQHMLCNGSKQRGCIQKIVKVLSSTVSTPTSDTDWVTGQTIFNGYTGEGWVENTGPDFFIQGFFTFTITSGVYTDIKLGDQMINGVEIDSEQHYFFRTSTGVIGTTSWPYPSVSISDNDLHDVYCNLDGTISLDSGDVKVGSAQLLQDSALTATTFGGSTYLNTTGGLSVGSSDSGLYPVEISGDTLVFTNPEMVNDYVAGGGPPTWPQVGGYYFPGTPCATDSTYRTSMYTADLDPIDLPPEWDNPMAGWTVSVSTKRESFVEIPPYGDAGLYSHNVYGYGYTIQTDVESDPCEISGSGIWGREPEQVLNMQYWTPSIEGEVYAYGIGVGGSVIRQVVKVPGTPSNPTFDLVHYNFYFHYGDSTVNTIWEQDIDADTPPVPDPIAGFGSYIPVSFDGDGIASGLVDGVPVHHTGAVGQTLTLVGGPILGSVVGLCDDGDSGVYAICDDTNLYHLIIDPSDSTKLIVDGSPVAAGVINEFDFIQLMRRRSNGDIIGMHGQSGSCQTFIISEGIVTQGTPFAFPTDTFETQESLSSGRSENTTAFSSAIGF